jgi:hypothetical protein
MEVTGAGERLPDDPRSNQFAVTFDQLSVGLAGKQQLREAGDSERIDQTEKDRGHQGEPQGDKKVFSHKIL